jgi:hypothetical protein
VAALTTAELEKWRNALVGAAEDREQQRRAQSTAERVRRTFFAALNYARRTNPDKVPSDRALSAAISEVAVKANVIKPAALGTCRWACATDAKVSSHEMEVPRSEDRKQPRSRR